MTEALTRPTIPDDAWMTCRRCRGLVYRKRYARELCVCPECGWHGQLTAQQRVDLLLDPQGRVPLGPPSTVDDPLGFTDTRPYRQRLAEARERTGLDDAVVCVRGRLAGRGVVLAVMDFRFLGGSLGAAAGEQVTRAAELALHHREPLILVTASGGARMQEGVLSLMQMVKTSQALARLDEAGVLTVAIVTDPTYGGVAASFASLTDVIIAEPGARLGFAGPRVIEQTIRRSLPPGFQSAEFLLDHGLIDAVVPRNQLRTTLIRLLAGTTHHPGAGRSPAAQPDAEAAVEPAAEATVEAAVAVADPTQAPADAGSAMVTDPDSLSDVDPWQVVKRARDIARPTTIDYLASVTDGFVELHGDRASADCRAIVGGVAVFEGRPAVVIGHQKGHSTRELIQRNFGMPSPAGYRKAARLMRLAAKLALPVITLIDTPGAYPGPEAEESGQAIAIAENIRLMARLPVPIVAVVTGEGGSGGALALGVADRVLILRYAVYSVISPEGCAAILWQSPTAASTAASALRLTPPELLRLGVVDGVVPEPDGGAQADQTGAAEAVRRAIAAAFDELAGVPAGELVRQRWDRFRRYGQTGAPTTAGGTR